MMKFKIKIRSLENKFLGGTSLKKRCGKMKINSKNEELDICVICGAITDVPLSKPIDNREFYEVGCGQLCRNCYIKLHSDEGINNVLSDEEIVYAAELSRKSKVKKDL